MSQKRCMLTSTEIAFLIIPASPKGMPFCWTGEEVLSFLKGKDHFKGIWTSLEIHIFCKQSINTLKGRGLPSDFCNSFILAEIPTGLAKQF